MINERQQKESACTFNLFLEYYLQKKKTEKRLKV